MTTDVAMSDDKKKEEEKKPLLGWTHIYVVDDDGVQKAIKGYYSTEPFFAETLDNGDYKLTSYFSPTNPLTFVKIEDMGKPSYFSAQFAWGKAGKPGADPDNLVCKTTWTSRTEIEEAFVGELFGGCHSLVPPWFESCEGKKTSKTAAGKKCTTGTIPATAIVPTIKDCHNRTLTASITLQSASFQLRVVGVEVTLPKDIYEEWYERWDAMKKSAKDDDKKNRKVSTCGGCGMGNSTLASQTPQSPGRRFASPWVYSDRRGKRKKFAMGAKVGICKAPSEEESKDGRPQIAISEDPAVPWQAIKHTAEARSKRRKKKGKKEEDERHTVLEALYADRQVEIRKRQLGSAMIWANACWVVGLCNANLWKAHREEAKSKRGQANLRWQSMMLAD
eukprot:gene409-767_t